MAETTEKSKRSRVRHSLVINFDSQAARLAFKTRLEHVRSILSDPEAEQPNLDNNGLMSAIFDHVERFAPSFPGSERASAVQSFNRNGGKYKVLASFSSN